MLPFSPARFGNPAALAGAAFVGPLDSYTSNLASAYSAARRLLTSYTGSLIRIRRSSDNAEQNIGYDSLGNLDTAAISAFVGSNSAYVVTIYDQSSTAANATNATASLQPRIVSSGTLDTVATGIPGMVFDGSNDYLRNTTVLVNNVRAYSTIMKSTGSTWNNYGCVVGGGISNGGSSRIGIFSNGGVSWHPDPVCVAVRKNGTALVANYNMTTINVGMVLGVDTGTATVYPTDTIILGSSGCAATGSPEQFYLAATITEAVVWTSVATRTGFEANQKAYIGL